MDKQWGDFQPVALSWDWANLQLNDGTDVMVTRLVNLNRGRITSHGTIRKRDDKPISLGPDDFTFRPRANGWISPETGAFYETVWDIEIPDQEVVAVAVADNVKAEYISSALGVVYWEAPVKILSHDGTALGQGFIELTGRARGD
jgi:predicted secreted hydrolase